MLRLNKPSNEYHIIQGQEIRKDPIRNGWVYSYKFMNKWNLIGPGYGYLPHHVNQKLDHPSIDSDFEAEIS